MITLGIILGVLVVLGVLVFAYGLIFRGDYIVAVSIVINKPATEVFATLVDLRSWEKWSPWLLHDPDCKLTYTAQPAVTAEGGNYSWHSEYIGAGKLTNRKLTSPSRIKQDIEFIKPFKSSAAVFWELAATDGGTKVTWGMAGTMPFGMRWMAARMPTFIAKDYNSGLVRLRQLLDPTAPRMQLSFAGVTEQPAYTFFGKSFAGKLADLKQTMKDDFPLLSQHEAVTKDSKSFCLVTEFSMRKDHLGMAYGFSPPPTDTTGLATFEIPAGRYYQVTLTGGYDMLDHAWHHAMNDVRMRKHKYDRRRQAYEQHRVGPTTEQDPNNFVTEIYVPIKS